MRSLSRRGRLAGGALIVGVSFLAMSTSGCLSGNFAPNMSVDGGGTPGEDPAVAFMNDVAPALAGSCNTCHTPPGLPPAPLFGATMDEITTYNSGSLITCAAPATSLLVAKGDHPPGSAFSPPNLAAVTAWIELFCGGGTPTGAAVTDPFVPQLGQMNTIDVAGLATGIAGAQVTFRAEMVGGGLYLTEIRAVAGASGLKLVAPVFEACLAGAARPDPSNAFSGVDLTVPAGETRNVGGGTLSLVDWELDNPIAIRFTAIGPEAGATGPYTPGGGSCGAAL